MELQECVWWWGGLLRKHALPLSPQEGSWGLHYALGKKTASLLLLDVVRVLKVFSEFLLCGLHLVFKV